MWILGGVVLAGVVVVLMMSSRRHDDGRDLGAVSGQWLVEYRQSKES
jgi:carbon starvation protein CstA